MEAKKSEGCYILKEYYCVIFCAESVLVCIGRNVTEDEGTDIVKMEYIEEVAVDFIRKERDYVNTKKDKAKARSDDNFLALNDA